MFEVTLKIKYLRDIKPVTIDARSDWIDLRAAETVTLEPFEYKEIPLGIAIEMPELYEALIIPRSSLYKKWGIICANSMGLIDYCYKGDNDELHFLALALRKTTIHKNDRIAQFRLLQHMPNVKITVVKTLGNEDRNGIGSTGEN